MLGYRYHTGARVVHLNQEPRFFHTHIPSGFYRRDLIGGLRFDQRLRASFEDAAFEAELLADLADLCVAYLPEAEYLYRRRADSVIGSMWSKPDRYTAVVEHGYLRLLSLHDPPPAWLQNLVLYDLLWMFYEYEQPDHPTAKLPVEVNERFWCCWTRSCRESTSRCCTGTRSIRCP